MKEKLNKILKKTILNELFIMEIVFFVGFFIISYTNFKVNRYFGLYFIGISFIAYSIFLFKNRNKGGNKS